MSSWDFILNSYFCHCNFKIKFCALQCSAYIRNTFTTTTSTKSQEFMPKVIRDFVYFVFMFIKLIFIQKYLHWTFHLC